MKSSQAASPEIPYNIKMVVIDGPQAVRLILVNTFFLVISIVIGVLRLLARRSTRHPLIKQLQLNDWLLITAILFQVCQTVLENLSEFRAMTPSLCRTNKKV